MADLRALPVYLRVGDLPEHEVGTITPSVPLAPDMARGLATAHVDVAGPLAELLHEMVGVLTAAEATQCLLPRTGPARRDRTT